MAAFNLVVQSLNCSLGVAVGEHLGYLLSGIWTAFVEIGLLSSSAVSHSGWYLVFGIWVISLGALLALYLPQNLLGRMNVSVGGFPAQ